MFVCCNVYRNNLEHVLEEKDGIATDSEPKFEEQISNKLNKANSIVGLIRRNFAILNAHLFIVWWLV